MNAVNNNNILAATIIRFAIQATLIMVGILGIVFTANSYSFMGGSSVFLFFTVQSNIYIIAMSFLFLVFEIIYLFAKKNYVNQVLLDIKYVATVAITITFLVFFTMLAPTLGLDYLLSFNNYSLHAIVPILAIIDFIIFDAKEINLSYPRSLLATISPIAYVIFVYIGVQFKLQYAENLYFPYFFLNYETNGFFFEKGFGVVPWIAILVVAISGLCLLFALFVKLRQKHQN